MKEFFEEYGRTVVTVLIILGIILVGYVIAGNGKTSAFGRFTSNIVDTLTRQDSSLIKDDSAYTERVAENKHAPAIIGFSLSSAVSSSTMLASVTTSSRLSPMASALRCRSSVQNLLHSVFIRSKKLSIGMFQYTS